MTPEESKCANIYCPNHESNVDHEEGDYPPNSCASYIGIPIDCEVRDKYQNDHCHRCSSKWVIKRERPWCNVCKVFEF